VKLNDSNVVTELFKGSPMRCDDVRHFAYAFLDGELEDQRAADFSRHLVDCPPCGERVMIHRRMRVLVRQRIVPVAAPTTLRDRIAVLLRTTPLTAI
jgi:mycothiol system anti-sigma-R factor